MGTLLYSKGIFINRCYDELNLSQPDLIRDIHQEYLQAGAEIIETNTFGANSFRLARHGCLDQAGRHQPSRSSAGARGGQELRRPGGGSRRAAWACASSLWARFHWPRHATAFRQQIAALNEEGVDLLILETFGYLEELHQAMLAAREVDPELPVVAQVTIDEEGNCLDGATPEHYGAQLEAWGADVIGCNCSVGPVAMLDALERVRAVTTAPLAAQPNAGMPRSVEGRNIYLCSPEYMAELHARVSSAAGVRLVGGCCGTTPEHIHAMKSVLARGCGALHGLSSPVAQSEAQTGRRRRPCASAPNLGRKIAAGEFVTMVEIVPPQRHRCQAGIGRRASFLKSVGVDGDQYSR